MNDLPPSYESIVDKDDIETTNPAEQLGPYPVIYKCNNCEYTGITEIEKSPNLLSHLLCSTFFILGCFIISFVPYLLDECNNIDHFCSNCNYFLGRYHVRILP